MTLPMSRNSRLVIRAPAHRGVARTFVSPGRFVCRSAQVRAGASPRAHQPAAPTWVPITGPISDTNRGSESKNSRPRSDEPLGLVGRLDVLHDPGVGAVLMAAAQVVHHALERAPRRSARAPGGDLGLHLEDRLDPQRRAQPRAAAPSGRRGAGTRACRCKTKLQRLARRLGPATTASTSSPARRRGARPARRVPARRRPSPSPRPRCAPGRPARRHAPWRRAPSRRCRTSRGQVDGDDVGPVVEQRLVHGEEVAHRGLRRGRQVGRGAQVLVVAVESGRSTSRSSRPCQCT